MEVLHERSADGKHHHDEGQNGKCAGFQRAPSSGSSEDDGPFSRPEDTPNAAQLALKYRELRKAMRADLAAWKYSPAGSFGSQQSPSQKSRTSLMSARSLNIIDSSDEHDIPVLPFPQMRTVHGQAVMNYFNSSISSDTVEGGVSRTASMAVEELKVPDSALGSVEENLERLVGTDSVHLMPIQRRYRAARPPPILTGNNSSSPRLARWATKEVERVLDYRELRKAMRAELAAGSSTQPRTDSSRSHECHLQKSFTSFSVSAQEDDVLESFFAASVRNLMHEFSDKSLELERVSSLASLGEVNMSVVEQTRQAAEALREDLVDSVSNALLCTPNFTPNLVSLISSISSAILCNLNEKSHFFARTSSAASSGDWHSGDRHSAESESREQLITPFLARHSFAGPEQIDLLLQALSLECDEEEKCLLRYAFMCPVCDTPHAPCTTLSDQLRAVTDAFRLIDADGDGVITLTDLRDIASWTSDDGGMEFVNSLVNALQPSDDELQTGDDAGEQAAEISEKDFTLAFARCLCGTVREAEIEEMLEQRAEDYRKIGQLFGMEKVQQHFSWNKFVLTFFADTFAFISFPLCKFLEHLRPSAGAFDRSVSSSSLYDILTESQWLPSPYASFDSFQHYLMSLWGPSIFSIFSYCAFYRYMEHISLMQVLSPLMIYCTIGTYIATISGYEHPKLVLRRLNMHLSSEVRQNELHAVFAFRAHTPEGHAVNHIGTIADVLFKNKFHFWTQTAAALAGILHACAPVFHRVFVEEAHTCTPGLCQMSERAENSCRGPWELVFWWVAGGNSMAHMVVSVPAAGISGYLCYRVIVISGGCLYHELEFYYKLILFRATTQAEPFLRFRARWIRAQRRMANFKGRREFLQFLNLQKYDDLVLWCRIRSLLIESYAGFKSRQHDILVTYILLYTLCFTLYIFFVQIRSRQNELSVFDIRARLDVFVFSLLLIVIINLKLNIHALRKSDISLLHKEYYAASMSLGMLLAAGGISAMPKPVHEMAEVIARANSAAESETSGGGGARPQSLARMTASSSRFQAAIVRRQNRSRTPTAGAPSNKDKSLAEERDESASGNASEECLWDRAPRSGGNPSSKFGHTSLREDDFSGEEGDVVPDLLATYESYPSHVSFSPCNHIADISDAPGLSHANQPSNNPDSVSFYDSSAQSTRRERERDLVEIVRGEASVKLAPKKLAQQNLLLSAHNTVRSNSKMYHPKQRSSSLKSASSGTFSRVQETNQNSAGFGSRTDCCFGRTLSVDGRVPLRTCAGGNFTTSGIATGPGDNVHVVQNLLDHTARYIQEFDRPPRLLSFTVSVHFLRYIFLPLLSPLIASLTPWFTGHAKV